MGVWDWLQPRRGGPEVPGVAVGESRQASGSVAVAPAQPAGPADMAIPISRPAPAAPATLINLSALSPAARRTAILSSAVNPALAWLAGRGVPSDARARQMLLTITGQEADAQFRRQHGNGPARGLWQFERLGGVAGVLSHRSSSAHAAAICAARGVEPSTTAVHPALERDDILAAAFARLLLWTDSAPLPADEEAGFQCYLRNWRPGAWANGSEVQRQDLRRRWSANWRLATAAMG